MLCLLLLHGFHMILFYQGSLFDLLVLAWARGQFCHGAWKKLHVAAMSFSLSFESGFAIKETFVEVCECWAKCGLCKSKFAALTSELFSLQLQTLPFQQRASDFFRGVKMIVFLTFWQALLLPGTSTNYRENPPRLETRTGDAGFPARPLAPLPGSTSKWEELPWCFLLFVDLHRKIHLKTCYQVVDAFFLVSHIAESETYRHLDMYGIGMFPYVRCELPRPAHFYRNTSSSTTFTFPPPKKKASPDFFVEHRRTSSSPLRWSSLAFWWIWHSHGWIPQFWKPSLSLQVLDKTSWKNGDPKHLGGHQEFFGTTRNSVGSWSPMSFEYFQQKSIFLCRRREFSLAQGTMTSQRGGFSDLSLPSFSLRFFFLSKLQAQQTWLTSMVRRTKAQRKFILNQDFVGMMK